MPKTRAQKEEVVSELAHGFQTAKGVVFVDFTGLKVKDATTLRHQARAAGVDYFVAKKTLIDLAAKSAGYEVSVKKMSGDVAVAFGEQDEIAAAKLLATIGKENTAVKILGGFLNGRLIDATEVKFLAALPSKEQLLTQLVGTLQAPIAGFVNVLAGNLRGLLNALTAIKEQKS